MPTRLNVRAVDVGYGHVKLTTGEDDGELQCDSFPSKIVASREALTTSMVMHRRDTHVVPVKDQLFEVGRGIMQALHGNSESDVLDQDFCLTDGYMARLYGAMNYMAIPGDSKVLDILVLGLPLTTYTSHHERLAALYSGKEHQINVRDKIQIKECHVYPQPLGSYMAYLNEELDDDAANTSPTALVVDPGYNTVDWFVCQGMVANEQRSSATQRGMSYVIRAIAETIVKKKKVDATVGEISRYVDAALTGDKSAITLFGEPLELKEFLSAGRSVIDEAVQAVKNSVGSGADIDTIVLTGGGASLYADALGNKFPHHKVKVLKDSAFANARGFHYLGDLLAVSAGRAAVLKG